MCLIIVRKGNRRTIFIVYPRVQFLLSCKHLPFFILGALAHFPSSQNLVYHAVSVIYRSSVAFVAYLQPACYGSGDHGCTKPVGHQHGPHGGECGLLNFQSACSDLPLLMHRVYLVHHPLTLRRVHYTILCWFSLWPVVHVGIAIIL